MRAHVRRNMAAMNSLYHFFFVVVVFTFDFTFANNEPAGAGPVSGPGTSSMEPA